jgi:hypothetical protein
MDLHHGGGQFPRAHQYDFAFARRHFMALCCFNLFVLNSFLVINKDRLKMGDSLSHEHITAL